MNDPKETDLAARRAELDAALSRKLGKRDQEDDGRPTDKSGWGEAAKMSSEFIGGVLAGAGIGYLVDKFAGTSPWGLIVFLLLGFGAGTLNILRATGKVADPHNPTPKSAADENSNQANFGDKGE